MMWWAWQCRGVRPQRMQPRSRGDQRGPLGADARPFSPEGEGMKVPVRLIPKITVHTAARQQIERSSAQGCRRPGWRCHWWAGSPIHEDGHRGHPAGVGVGRRRLRHVGQGIGAALGRGGGVVGVRGAGERCQGFGQDRPVDLVEHSGDRPHPVRPGGQAQGAFGALLIRLRSRWVGLSASAATCSTRRTSEASVNFARPTIAACLLVKSSIAGAWARI